MTHMSFEFARPTVIQGDCAALIPELPDESIDIVVTSPPYWGQRTSLGTGTEDDPRDYISFLQSTFTSLIPKLKSRGIVWLNLGDAYNTPINWTGKDFVYSSLGPDRKGFAPDNAAYTKPRHRRRAYIEQGTNWLQYGNMLMLPQRLLLSLVDAGYVYRGEVIWAKKNAMPEGRCRRPHRRHESIYLLARSERHGFRTKPPVPSVWSFANENVEGVQHRSRFPTQLPRMCIEAYGSSNDETTVLDPFSGSGTTGVAAVELGCRFLGFEIDPVQAEAANNRLSQIKIQSQLQFNE